MIYPAPNSSVPIAITKVDLGSTKAQPLVRSAASLRLKTFPPLEYIVPPFVVPGCTVLAGNPKIGKSWLSLDAGLATASGGYCLGDKKCKQGDVLFLALEDNERRLQSRITKILGCFDGEWPARFEYATEWPRAKQGGLDQIRAWIERAKEPALVVVDVLAMFRSARLDTQTSYDGDYEALKGLQQIASDSNVAILVTHHLRKGAAEGGDPFERVSGTLGLTGAADSAAILARDSNGTTLYCRGRDIEEIEAAVQFDRTRCRWTILGDAADVRRTDERTRIINALRDSGDEMSPTELASITNMPSGNIRQLLLKLVKAGEIDKTGRGRYRAPAAPSHPPNIDNKITNSRIHHDG